jgi:hypothetical protein
MAIADETVKLHKMINGKLHPLEMKRQNFEKIVDRIDKAVDKGASFKEILVTFADHIVNHDGALGHDPANGTAPVKPVAKPAVVASQPVGNKAEIVASIARANPHMSASMVAKKVAAQNPTITYANAYYLANKLMKAS